MTLRTVASTTSDLNPGRIGAVQRLNRAEYNNAIRDLFALDMDVKPLLPGDDTADGSFDNFRSESRPNRRGAAAESRGVQQRDSRSVRAGHGREASAAGR